MKKLNFLYLLLPAVFACTKNDLTNVSPEAASANKGIPVLSEVWKNGVLQQKSIYGNGRLVSVSFPSGASPEEYHYSYRDKDHYAVMTGDYMYYHYYFNDDHHLVRVDLSDHDDALAMLWVRHEFTWEKDRIRSHSWMIGNFSGGTISGTEEYYEYKDPWEAMISEYAVAYAGGVKTSAVLIAEHHYQWKSPFEFRFFSGPGSYSANIYSTTVKTPSFNTVGFPWGYYQIENLNKHELMNLLTTSWNASVSHGSWKNAALSGMLQVKEISVSDGKASIIWELQNLVVNKDKLPDSYDVYDHASGNVTHYEYKYVRL